MSSSKLFQAHKRVNDLFREKLAEEFFSKFRRKIVTEYNIISMAFVSYTKNGKPFTEEQKHWVMAFEAGYVAAMGVVWEQWVAEDNKRQQRAAEKWAKG